ncbi:MAG TPA: hypothetical protein VK327_01460 [Candidatus Paceibacterota bacterium]|nr:hypothetical protein [Candidatus Paceibacterota bacterium]
MKTRLFTKWVAAIACGCLIGANANALTITIGSSERTGSLTSATQGATANDANLFASTVNTAFGGTWTERGHLDSGTSDDLFTISLTTGGWNGTHVTGIWSIAPSFWTIYGKAVIGWHVGNGQGSPDEFMFLVTQGQTTGTWSYDRLDGGGGGFSNIQLFGSEKPRVSVPDVGATILLLGTALSGLGLITRRFKN